MFTKMKTNYKKYLFIFIFSKVILFAILIALGLFLLKKENDTFIEILSQKEISFHYTKRERVLHLSGLYYEYRDPSFIGKEGESTIEAASPKLMLGGTWRQWVKSLFNRKIYLSLPSSLLVKIQNQENTSLRLSAQNIALAVNKKDIDFTSDFLLIKTLFNDITLQNMDYHLESFKHKEAHHVIYGSKMKVKNLYIHFNLINYSQNIADIALLGSVIQTTSQETSQETYKILIDHLSAKTTHPPFLSVSLGGALSLPAMNGHFTITIPHWHNTARDILEKDNPLPLSALLKTELLQILHASEIQGKKEDLVLSFDFTKDSLMRLADKTFSLLPALYQQNHE